MGLNCKNIFYKKKPSFQVNEIKVFFVVNKIKVAPQGLEPQLTAPKTAVLPIKLQGKLETKAQINCDTKVS